jgi:hypothetical protein
MEAIHLVRLALHKFFLWRTRELYCSQKHRVIIPNLTQKGIVKQLSKQLLFLPFYDGVQCAFLCYHGAMNQSSLLDIDGWKHPISVVPYSIS